MFQIIIIIIIILYHCDKGISLTYGTQTFFLQELYTGQGFFVMFFGQGKDFFK